MVEITGVERGSYADRAGVLPGDLLSAVNGHEIGDVLDYRFHICSPRVRLSLTRGGRALEFAFKKPEYADIGLNFDTYIMDGKRGCANKCVFCFIDQLPPPPALRESLYFKDDDERLSFLFGNYITLTNLGERQLERIIKMRISPVNISVHTTNPELRVKMMGNPRAGEVLAYIGRLAGAGINLNTQLVLCRGINDGEELERTLADLSAYYPAMNSIAAVPAGLTRYREARALPKLEPYDKEGAARIIAALDAAGEANLRRFGARLVYAADEWYLRAGLPIPGADYYEGYPQLENGVGMLRDMEDEFRANIGAIEPPKKPRRVAVATGGAAYGLIRELAAEVEARCSGLECAVYRIENKFFGPEVTVAGLLTGSDFAQGLSPHKGSLGEALYIPASCLRAERDLFLDGMTPAGLSALLGVPVLPIEPGAVNFINALTGKFYGKGLLLP